MGLITVDIGNSSVKWAHWTAGEHSGVRRSASDDVEGISAAIAGAAAPEDRVVVVSVVPAVEAALRSAIARRGLPAPIGVSASMRLPFTMAYETPQTLGADRVAAIAGALDRAGRPREIDRPVIVVDAGTAVTVDVLDRSGRYLGGTISPGPRLMHAGLIRGTAQLPPVPFELPPSVIGRTTDEAIRSGLLYGFAGMVEGIVRRVTDETGGDAWVVGTGGWASLLRLETGILDEVDPDLVLRGAVFLADLNG